MKLVLLFCTCFISLYSLGSTDDQTSSPDTTLPVTEAISTLPDDLTKVTSVAETETKSTFDDASVSSLSVSPESTVDTTPITEASTTITTETSKPTTNESTLNLNSTLVIIKLSHQIRMILEHFQDDNPVGFPGQNMLPDPLPAPNVSEGLGIIGRSDFYNITVHGLSNFTVVSVNMLLDQMEVYVKIRIKDVYILGNCTQSSAVFFSSQGPFNLTLTNVTAEGVVFLVVDPDGSLRANRSMTKIGYEKVMFHLGDKNTAPLSSVVDVAGLAVISTILPFIQALIDERLTSELNKQLKDGPKFPAIRDISPIDLAIMKGREYVSSKHDPYVVKNIIDFDSDYLSLKVGPVTLQGLSNFARVGDVSFGMVNKTAVIKMRMITGKLNGKCQFYLNFGKVAQVPGRQGGANFSVEHLQFEAVLHQSLNMKQKPRLEDLQLEVGPIKVKLDRQGNFDYVIEMVVGRLPDFLRYYLIDILEEPIKRKIQKDILDEVNVEEVVTNNLPVFEQLLNHQGL